MISINKKNEICWNNEPILGFEKQEGLLKACVDRTVIKVNGVEEFADEISRLVEQNYGLSLNMVEKFYITMHNLCRKSFLAMVWGLYWYYKKNNRFHEFLRCLKRD
jgi:hypothetical protein